MSTSSSSSSPSAADRPAGAGAEGVSPVETFWAGALAGLVAETIMHPFDTVSHRAKVHPSSGYGTFAGAFRLLYTQEGIRGYFAGLSATLAQSPPSTAVYFLTYESAKAAGFGLTGGKHADLVYFSAGAASEIFASIVFVPLEVVKSRLQLGDNPHRATGGVVQSTTNFPSIRAALAGIYAERGWAGLTAGWKSGFIQDIVFSATQFLVYENAKAAVERRHEERRRREMTTMLAARSEPGGGGGAAAAHHSSSSVPKKGHATTIETLACGCLSGGIAAAITNPFDVITSRLMVQDGRAGYGGATMRSVFEATVKEGPGALWNGTVPRVAQIAPLSAISFAVFEGMRTWFKDTALFSRLSQGENPFASGPD